ncbi:hypothetical protein H257_10723 [Aphanomyces astaci]|uniref:Uncharacterized protein n=1 Tax=Aphanomyces astaci TaxID=112090 RepID=W4G4F8_APHAT|nr:hypothetical protein H257_10723 [Aphanomyces astaci]ETV74577.1 hypothetical protein H257_10723 [Aphanomyces astaci]|eukprot:XP_009835664.1 hypothetical protein H257_10723 [Aphanomyces astaci]
MLSHLQNSRFPIDHMGGCFRPFEKSATSEVGRSYFAVTRIVATTRQRGTVPTTLLNLRAETDYYTDQHSRASASQAELEGHVF